MAVWGKEEKMEQKRYNIEEAKKAQVKYQEDTKSPDFAPGDGFCWGCKRNIYSEGGIDVERASKELVTGCPFCHRSYCD